MPASIIKSFAKKTGKSVSEIEKKWQEAKKIAASMGKKEEYDYIVGILKNILGINESITDIFLKSGKNFKEFYEEITSSDLGELPENPPVGSFKKRKKDKNETEEDGEKENKKVKVGMNK
jgi:hypothetical protein